MDKIFSILLVFMALASRAQTDQPLPQVMSGKLERMENFPSNYVTRRNIDIWLPEGYTDTSKYPVLYMHDGQMLYDSSQTWNKQAWDIDDVATGLFIKGRIRECIVVGIWNGGLTRHADYFPQKPFESLTQREKDTITAQLQRAGRTKNAFRPRSDDYLKFIVEELKPTIESRYSVLTGRENTFIAGSSMGALISMYALCEYPGVFGGAACLSTHWVGTFAAGDNPLPESFITYLSYTLPEPGQHKIYFDYGDQTLDALYPEFQIRADSVMKSKGYTENHWVTKYFPGADHSERSWKKRLNEPLEFLLKK